MEICDLAEKKKDILASKHLEYRQIQLIFHLITLFLNKYKIFKPISKHFTQT